MIRKTPILNLLTPELIVPRQMSTRGLIRLRPHVRRVCSLVAMGRFGRQLWEATGKQPPGGFSSGYETGAGFAYEDGGLRLTHVDGRYGYYTIQNAVGLPVAANAPFTITYVFKSNLYCSLGNNFGFGRSLPASTGTGQGRYSIEYNNRFYFWGISADNDTGISYPTDKKQHVVSWVSDGTNLYLWLDGAFIWQAAHNGSWSTAGSHIYVGSGHSNASGDEDQIFYYGDIADYCLSDNEIRAIHQDWLGTLFEPLIPHFAYAAGGVTPYPVHPGAGTATGVYKASTAATGLYKGASQLWP